jgi:RHS repeat-associated protein
MRWKRKWKKPLKKSPLYYCNSTNGMLVADDNKGITAMHYNALGLVDTVTWTNGNRLVYTYTGAGERIRKSFLSATGSLTTHYTGGVQYNAVNGNSSSFDFARLPGARVRKSADTLRFEYDLADHLGNTRLTFDEDPLNPGHARLLQYNSYYAFGGTMPGPGVEFVNGQKNRYLYNNKELQEETGLYDYGPRMYDGQTGRWTVADPLAGHPRQYDKSPYMYGWGNPVVRSDPSGLCPECDEHVENPTEGSVYESKGGETYYYDGTQWTRQGGELEGVVVSRRYPSIYNDMYTGSGKYYHSVLEEMLRDLSGGTSSDETYDQRRAREEALSIASMAADERLARVAATRAKEILERNKLLSLTNRKSMEIASISTPAPPGLLQDKLSVSIFTDVKSLKSSNPFFNVNLVYDERGEKLQVAGVSVLGGLYGVSLSTPGIVSQSTKLGSLNLSLGFGINNEGLSLTGRASFDTGANSGSGVSANYKMGAIGYTAIGAIITKGASVPVTLPALRYGF